MAKPKHQDVNANRKVALESSGIKRTVDLSQNRSLCLHLNIFTHPFSFIFRFSFMIFSAFYIWSEFVPAGIVSGLHYALLSSCFVWMLLSVWTLISIKSGFSPSLPFSSFSGSFLQSESAALVTILSSNMLCDTNGPSIFGKVMHLISMQMFYDNSHTTN